MPSAQPEIRARLSLFYRHIAHGHRSRSFIMIRVSIVIGVLFALHYATSFSYLSRPFLPFDDGHHGYRWLPEGIALKSMSFTSTAPKDPTSPKIGKISMLYGDSPQVYDRAMELHKHHNENFGYTFHVLRHQALPGFWSKPAYILNRLLAEMSKPKNRRLDWLVWVDADTVIMNPKIPLEVFLPLTTNTAQNTTTTAADWSHIHLLVTNDHRGLNNGVFFLRVHEWSVWLMNACLGTQTLHPDIELRFGDQSALEYWLSQPSFGKHTMHVPQRWFNAYSGYRGSQIPIWSDPNKKQFKVLPNSVKEGDLLVHHAGKKALRVQRMEPWLNVAERHSSKWELDLGETTYLQEIEEFWKTDALKENEMQQLDDAEEDQRVVFNSTRGTTIDSGDPRYRHIEMKVDVEAMEFVDDVVDRISSEDY